MQQQKASQRKFPIHSDNVVMFQDLGSIIYAIPYSIKINSKFSISNGMASEKGIWLESCIVYLRALVYGVEEI